MKENIRSFRLKYRLPINHSMRGIEDMHHHVIELEIEFECRNTGESIDLLNNVENRIESVLGVYRNSYINDMEEFNGNSTIENMGEVFFERLNLAFRRNAWIIKRFEISETPLRVYAIVVKD